VKNKKSKVSLLDLKKSVGGPIIIFKKRPRKKV
jgi:hypothetical protein